MSTTTLSPKYQAALQQAFDNDWSMEDFADLRGYLERQQRLDDDELDGEDKRVAVLERESLEGPLFGVCGVVADRLNTGVLPPVRWSQPALPPTPNQRRAKHVSNELFGKPSRKVND